jgi:hypothetical protein
MSLFLCLRHFELEYRSLCDSKRSQRQYPIESSLAINRVNVELIPRFRTLSASPCPSSDVDVSVEVEVMWVSQFFLVSGTHLGPMIIFLLLSDIYGFFLCGAPTLTRGRACNLLVHWLLRQRCYSRGQVPQNLWPYCSVSFETFPTWRARSPYYIL